jgi:hypothetical protein
VIGDLNKTEFTMSTDLIKKLIKLPTQTFLRNEGADEQSIIEIEKAIDHKLPEDFRELLIHSDGGSIQGKHTTFNYEPSEYLIGHNLSEFFNQNIPDMFVIGDDGGGCIYFYDPLNILKNGSWSLYYASMGALTLNESIFLSKNLTDAINKILAGESFGDLLFRKN